MSELKTKIEMASNAKTAFRTHLHYLRSFQFIIALHHLPYHRNWPAADSRVIDSLARSVRSSRHFQRTRGATTSADIPTVRAILRNAWGTELLLLTTAQLPDDELMSIANNWAVVQAYYSCYHASQALLVARGQRRPEDHASTLHQAAEFFTRSELTPWALGYRAGRFLGFPPDIDDAIHHLTPPDYENCWSLSAKALRTTRKEPLAIRRRQKRLEKRSERRKAWLETEGARLEAGRKPRKRPSFPVPVLTEDEKSSLDQGLSPTTLLDYLCRLRLKTNYKDPTMFTDGPDDVSESRETHQLLCQIVSATLLVHELYIAKTLGVDQFRPIIDEWLTIPSAKHAAFGLSTRRDTLLAL